MANATTTRIDSDLDAQSPAADLVRVYLNGIGKTALLSAEDEVELAKRIEAGLYATQKMAELAEVGTKLDLARAYIDMGDHDGARSILEEVLDEGGEAHQQQARQLLNELND